MTECRRNAEAGFWFGLVLSFFFSESGYTSVRAVRISGFDGQLFGWFTIPVFPVSLHFALFTDQNNQNKTSTGIITTTTAHKFLKSYRENLQ